MDISQNTEILDKGETMKIEKKLWITLFVFGLSVIHISDGVVAEKGSHETLMKKNGLYRKLVDLQTESTNWKLNTMVK